MVLHLARCSSRFPFVSTPNVPVIGLIANPLASKDVRRLVGLARVVDVEEKANLIARLLVGMTAGPVVRVVALPDSGGLVERAVRLTRGRMPDVEFLPMDAESTEADSRRAAEQLRDLGAALIVVVGGDGTIRSVVEGWPDSVLVPVAAGTNNAISIVDEPTVVGFATALATADGMAERVLDRCSALSVDTGHDRSSVAVVDVVGVRTRWVGSGALWDGNDLVEAIVTNVRPTAVGIAAVAAALGDLPAGAARYIRFGDGQTVRALLGPGLVTDIGVAHHEIIELGEKVELDPASRVVALDGERRLVSAGRCVVEVLPGPKLLSVRRAMEYRNHHIEGRQKSP